jgi:hypothetical protein
MAGHKKSKQSRERTLYEWIANATESGDPKLWSRILELYKHHPNLRWVTLWHIPFYWTEHPGLVVPLVREALRDPALTDVAVQAAAAFPSLRRDVVDCLQDLEVFGRVDRDQLPFVVSCLQERRDVAVPLVRAALRYSGSAPVAVHAASVFPELTDEVVACLQAPPLLDTVGPDAFVASMACLFGLMEGPSRNVCWPWGGPDPILAGVREELKQRYFVDLDELVAATTY